MSDEQLVNIQYQLFMQFGYKVDVYHFESDRTVYVYPHMSPTHPDNLIQVIEY